MSKVSPTPRTTVPISYLVFVRPIITTAAVLTRLPLRRKRRKRRRRGGRGGRVAVVIHGYGTCL
jgi:hypothetical protein